MMAALGTLGMQYDDTSASPVICIQDAYKSYGSQQALAGVNLSVYPGTIFALLGPSGCGKTTLVNAIVGRSDLDAGSIFTSLKDLKEIGFMPQDISLFTRLSVRENMRFYGYLHNLDVDEIERRSKYLSDLLALPPFSRRPLNLSGGQQRRVSLAVALLHDPKVLILDEPTVGLDPILSKNFWDRLREMANQGKTVVLTTHYIEEARQADRIGLMRNGKMLTQDTPLALLKEYNTDYLEDVFLALCYQESNKTFREISKEETSFSKVRTFDKPKRISLSRIKAQLLKNVYVLKNNLVLTIFGLMLPLVLNICAKIAFAHDPYYLPLAIVNEEFPGSVENCPRTFTNSCILSNPEMMASCIFLNELKNRTYVMTEYSNYEDALQDHVHKRNRGIVQFASNFTESLSERFMVGLMGASEFLYESSTIQVLLDGAEMSIKDKMQRDLSEAFLTTMQQTVEICTDLVKPGALGPALHIEDPIFGDKSWNFFIGFQIGFTIIGSLFCSMVFSSATMLEEKMEGSLDRVLSNGVSMWDIMIGHVLLHSITSIFYTVETYFILADLIPLKGSPYLLMVILLCTGMTGVFLGGVIGLVTDHLLVAVNGTAGFNFAFVCLTGLVWPIEGAHASLRMILPYVPVTSTIQVVKDIGIRGYGFLTPVVAKGMVQVVFWMIASLLAEILVIKMRKGTWSVRK